MSPNDKHIIDLHPVSRPLTNPNDVLSFSKIIPHSTYVPYSELPFFSEMNKRIGVDPLKGNIQDYVAARNKYFESMPQKELKLDHLVATQKVVNRTKIESALREERVGRGGSIFAVKYRGQDLRY